MPSAEERKGPSFKTRRKEENAKKIRKCGRFGWGQTYNPGQREQRRITPACTAWEGRSRMGKERQKGGGENGYT